MNSHIPPIASPLTKRQAAQESLTRGNADDRWYFDHPFYCLHCDAKLTRKNWFPKNWDRTDQWYPSRWNGVERYKCIEICQSCNTPEATERRDRERMEAAVKALRLRGEI